MNIIDRAKHAPSRRVMTIAGVATIAFSLIVSIGPALAAPGGNGNGNGNAGTVKVHDAATTLEAVGNDPTVCSFWVGFYSDGAEVGTWELRSWAPTGDGSLVASGTYDTSGDGVDATSTLTFANGHYRFEWAANGSNAKQKTFWVSCDTTSSDEAAPSDDATPSDEAAPSDAEGGTSSEDVPPSDEETPSQDESSTPSGDESTPDDQGQTENGGDPGASQEPEQDVKSGNSHDDPGSVDASQSGSGNGSGMPDTATSNEVTTGMGGVLAAIGILLIVLAHAGTRRERLLPTA